MLCRNAEILAGERKEARAGYLLQPTALVNEAYIRLIDWKNVTRPRDP